jgi:hypothetical protein
MAQVLLLIKTFAPLFYLIGAGFLLLGLRSWWLAREELAFAQFRLEREQAQQWGGRAITQTVLSFQFIILVYLLAAVTYPAFDRLNRPAAAVAPVVNVQSFGTTVPEDRAGQLLVPTAGSTGVVLVQTQPPSPTFAGTVLPADDKVGCIADQATITIPNNGQLVYETISIRGVANIANFSFYRFELRSVDRGEAFFGVIDGNYFVPVAEEGQLGNFIPQNFTPGEYDFRLAVFDNSGNLQAACEISLFVSDPLPTPTPIGGVPAPPGN